MRRMILAALAAGVCALSCDNPVGPRTWPAFTGKELHYRRSGTWVGYIGVAIYEDGTVHAFKFAPAPPGEDTLSVKSRRLSRLERRDIEGFLDPLMGFERWYPHGGILDLPSSHIELIYEGRTVKTVSAPWGGELPSELWDLISEIESLWNSTMNEDSEYWKRPNRGNSSLL